VTNFGNAVFAAILAAVLMPQVSLGQDQTESGAGPESMRGMTADERRTAYEALSEEEQQAVRKRRREARDQQRAEWQKMTPEERAARLEEVRARAEELTPEQRDAIRERRERNQNATRNPNRQPQQDKEPES